MELIYIPLPTNLNTLRTSQFGLSGQGGPPEVGITTIRSTVPRLLISLDAISTDTFWQLHRAYHVTCPKRKNSLGLLESGGRGRGGRGPAVVVAGPGAIGGRLSVVPGGVGPAGGGPTVFAAGEESTVVVVVGTGPTQGTGAGEYFFLLLLIPQYFGELGVGDT